MGRQNNGKVTEIPATSTGTPLDSIVATTGNAMTIRGNSGDYCIIGTNPGGDRGVAGINYSSTKGGLNRGTCSDSFIPITEPAKNGELIVGEGVGKYPGVPEVPVAATCADIVFTPSAGSNVTCSVSSTNWSQDIFYVTVKSTSATPVEWNLNINAARAKGYIKTDLDSSNAFNNYSVATPAFNVVGTDRSWNGDPAAANNYKFIDSNKTMTFTVRVMWR